MKRGCYNASGSVTISDRYMYKTIDGKDVLIDLGEISAVKAIEEKNATQITLKSGITYELSGVYRSCVTENGHFVLLTDKEIASSEIFAAVWFSIILIALVILVGYGIYIWLFT